MAGWGAGTPVRPSAAPTGPRPRQTLKRHQAEAMLCSAQADACIIRPQLESFLPERKRGQSNWLSAGRVGERVPAMEAIVKWQLDSKALLVYRTGHPENGSPSSSGVSFGRQNGSSAVALQLGTPTLPFPGELPCKRNNELGVELAKLHVLFCTGKIKLSRALASWSCPLRCCTRHAHPSPAHAHARASVRLSPTRESEGCCASPGCICLTLCALGLLFGDRGRHASFGS